MTFPFCCLGYACVAKMPINFKCSGNYFMNSSTAFAPLELAGMLVKVKASFNFAIHSGFHRYRLFQEKKLNWTLSQKIK